MRPPTPEEKLLRLIRGKAASAQPAAASAGAPAPSLPRRVTGWPISGWQWVLAGTVVLGLVLAVEVAALVVQLTRPVPTIQIPSTTGTTATATPSDPSAASAPVVEPIPSLAQATARPVFTAPVATRAPSTGASSAPSQDAKALAGRLTLTGIITGDPPQAIIEDSETKKTFFVSPGQVVVDGAVVDRVSENRVVLNLQGEKVELGL